MWPKLQMISPQNLDLSTSTMPLRTVEQGITQADNNEVVDIPSSSDEDDVNANGNSAYEPMQAPARLTRKRRINDDDVDEVPDLKSPCHSQDGDDPNFGVILRPARSNGAIRDPPKSKSETRRIPTRSRKSQRAQQHKVGSATNSEILVFKSCIDVDTL